ncbi:MAG: IS66 family transposase, partial [Dehalococcoidia bacterium]
MFMAMQTHIEELEAHVRELEVRLGQNSQNSSRPPSADPPSFQRSKRSSSPTRRKRGAQPGHLGHHRIRYSKAEVDEVVELHPSVCDHCSIALEGPAEEEKDWRHQVVELPEVKAKVTEYRLHSRRCPECGQRVQAQLPPGVPQRHFGPIFQATAAILTGRYRLSRREAQQLLDDLWSAKISLGALSSLEEVTSGALKNVVSGVAQSVKRAGIVNIDETGWRENDGRAWLWTAVVEGKSLFHIDPRRSGDVVEKLLGEDLSGVVGTDRYSAYKRMPIEQRALCYAHLKRNFQALVDREGEAASVGRRGLRELERVFGLWHSYCDGEVDWQGLQHGLKPIKARFGKLLKCGKRVDDPKARALCKSLSELWDGLWTFSKVEGVEP